MAVENVLLCTALTAALENEVGVEVLAHVNDAMVVEELVERHEPGLLLITSTLLRVCGRSGSVGGGRCRVLVVNGPADHATMVSSFEAGAHGYLSESSSFASLLSAMTALSRGESVVPPEMLGGLLHELVLSRRREQAGREKVSVLSRREREVLELLAGGQSQGAIARTLVISPQTARTHIQNVIGKLGAHSRVEAVAIAIESGLVRAS